jgi:hypothetical protein
MSEEILNQNESATNAMTVTESMKSDLLCAAKWAKFLCIVGCVGVALMLLEAVAMMAFGAMATKLMPDMPFGAAMGVLYLIIAALYIYPLMKGFQFANATKVACLYNDQFQLARGVTGLKDLIKFTGILTIVVISICVIVIVFTILFAAIGIAAMQH